MKKYLTRKTIGWTALIALILIQFFQIDRSLPSPEPAKDFITSSAASPEIAAMLKNACYECHSYTVEYPWYTAIQPIGWWIKGHIKEGTKHLNFATWTDYDAKKADHKLEECIDMVKNGEMPLASYTWMHPTAKLTDAQREALVTWFQNIRI